MLAEQFIKGAQETGQAIVELDAAHIGSNCRCMGFLSAWKIIINT